MRLHTALLTVAALGLASCAAPAAQGSGEVSASSPSSRSPLHLHWRKVAEYPHDPAAFTQGLLWHDGRLYESTGQPGHSTLREVELASGRVLRSAALPDDEFGEGLALVGERLLQLTWQNGVVHVWNRASFESSGRFALRGEGWGLAYDGEHLISSDGSSILRFRDPATFETVREQRVLRDGRPQFYLNELEFAAGALWANVWLSDEIVRIDPVRGEVTGVVDLSGLLTPSEAVRADVLNGIAWNGEERLYYVTGKYWPKLFALAIDEPATD